MNGWSKFSQYFVLRADKLLLNSTVSPSPKLQSLLNMIDRLLDERQTPVDFTPVKDNNVDATALALDTDVSDDVTSDVSYQSNRLDSDQRVENINMGDASLTDGFKPSKLPDNHQRLLDSIKDGQLPFFFDNKELLGNEFKSYLNSLPSQTPKNQDETYGKTSQNSNSDSKTPQAFNPRIWTGDSPGFSRDGLGEGGRQSDFAYNTELKEILEKWLQKNRQGAEANDDSSYYDNTYDNTFSQNIKDKLSDDVKLLLGQHGRVDDNSQDVLSNRLPLEHENTQYETQKIDSDFRVSPSVSTQQKSPVCWDGQILYNYTLVGGINAGTFSDNGKTNNMDLCMQYCCNRESCDLAFMIEDDCYSVACNSNGVCEPRKARPTHYNPRIAIRKKPQGNSVFIIFNCCLLYYPSVSFYFLSFLIHKTKSVFFMSVLSLIKLRHDMVKLL